MSISTPTIAVLGTGLIGAPVARNLAAKGFQVRAWNRSPAKAQALEQAQLKACASVAEAVQGATHVVTVLKDGDSVAAAMRAGAGHFHPGALWLQLSTVGIEASEQLARLAAELGLAYIDAPVQGTRQPAEQGQLVILASGPQALREQAQPLFDAIGKRTLWVSDTPGQSSRLKLALNNWAFALTHGSPRAWPWLVAWAWIRPCSSMWSATGRWIAPTSRSRARPCWTATTPPASPWRMRSRMAC